MGPKKLAVYITGAWLKIHDLRALLTKINTPYIAFTVLFSLINNINRNVNIAYMQLKNNFTSLHDTLLKFGFKSPQVHFKCTV